MNKEKLLQTLEKTTVNKSAVAAVESVYGKCSNPDVQKVISISVKPKHSKGWRVLSLNEVINASKQLKVDFVKKKLIPMIDLFDNDFVVYDLKNSCWKVFNIVEEIAFMQAKTLFELLEDGE